MLREQKRCGEIINIRRDRKTRRGETSSIRRMQRSEDSRIKIEAEVKIMYKQATLTRSTMQNRDREPKKEEHEAKLGDKDNNLK